MVRLNADIKSGDVRFGTAAEAVSETGHAMYDHLIRATQEQLFAGPDLEWTRLDTEISQPSAYHGEIVVPLDYFDLVSGFDLASISTKLGISPELALRELMLVLINQRGISLRSSLVQAGTSFWYDSVADRTDSVVLNVGLFRDSYHGVPFVNVPDQFGVGRLIVGSHFSPLTEGDVTSIGCFQGFRTVGGFVYLPIEKYMLISQDQKEINLGDILTLPSHKARDDLDEIIGLEPTPRDKLTRDRSSVFYIAETGEISLPNDISLLVVVGSDDGTVHLPSYYVKPKYDGRIRMELLSGASIVTEWPFAVHRDPVDVQLVKTATQ